MPAMAVLWVACVATQAAPVQIPDGAPPAAFAGTSTSTSTNGVYRFAAGDSVAHDVEWMRTPDGLRFSWPNVGPSTWDTALVSVSSWGAESQPWIEITAGGHSLRQDLDPNALGERWLNLSGLRAQLSPGTEIVLKTHAVTLAAERANLRLFDNRLDLHRRILIVAPHPDDAEIAAFGLYADRSSSIVTVTSGNAGDMNYRVEVSDPAEHYRLKGYLRAVDSVTVPWQGGIAPERSYNLGYFDGRLDTMYATPERVVPEVYGPNSDVLPYRRANIGTLLPIESRTNTWHHLVDDLATVLQKVNPEIIVMPDPRLDAHLDHEFTSVAVVQALERWHGNAVFLLYTNHIASNRYPYGPAGGVMSLPPTPRDIELQRVYSHATDAALQIRKTFALESMHDLRLSPDEQMLCDTPGVARRPDYPRAPAEDYLRRAPRANELFYVFDRDGARKVIEQFLTNRVARDTP
jgi:hypothetical protein